MPSPAESYFATASDILARACEINAATLKTGGQLIGESIATGGVLHTFGSGNSEIIGRESIARAGGLIPGSGICPPGCGTLQDIAASCSHFPARSQIST